MKKLFMTAAVLGLISFSSCEESKPEQDQDNDTTVQTDSLGADNEPQGDVDPGNDTGSTSSDNETEIDETISVENSETEKDETSE